MFIPTKPPSFHFPAPKRQIGPGDVEMAESDVVDAPENAVSAAGEAMIGLDQQR